MKNSSKSEYKDFLDMLFTRKLDQVKVDRKHSGRKNLNSAKGRYEKNYEYDSETEIEFRNGKKKKSGRRFNYIT